MLCFVGSTHAGTHQMEGRIVGVNDGDTITLLDATHRQHKIRLDGIDAPELRQPFGRASKQQLAAQVRHLSLDSGDFTGRVVRRINNLPRI